MKIFGGVRRLMLMSLTVMCGLCSAAHAQDVLDNTGLLGMSAGELTSRLPGIQAVRAPRRLSSGALGSLRVPDALYGGLHFEQTLYLAHQKLQQTDLVLNSPEPGQVDTLMQTLRARLGPELASSFSTSDALIDTASWVNGDADVTLFHVAPPARPGIRLVIKQRQLRDASEL
ncbi:MAG: hypothetical protein V4625_20235 [Pseudomonadota bacterium]